ncbi:unnamed protein product [Clavelina lepadiformis]|uniref:Uncharacterized protein n=1 Tax=Clavelina lepadiformis TaxID=159417 RepID=A0ABP0F2N5_CLALP
MSLFKFPPIFQVIRCHLWKKRKLLKLPQKNFQRESFLDQVSFLSNSAPSHLNEEDREIIRRHKEADKLGNLFYEDPKTKYIVWTRSYHLKRGDCCGSACRHCPYHQSKVKDDRLKKVFNGYFYK